MRMEYAFRYLEGKESTPVDERQHMSLNALLDLIDLVSRSDTTVEIIKELERISNNLSELQHLPGVDRQRLTNILENVDSLTRRLGQQSSRHYQSTIDAELLSTLKRRHNISCGNTEFDQPLLKHWLIKPEQEREQQLQTWMQPFTTLKLAVQLILQLIRESAETVPSVALGGFYQHTLDSDQPAQLIRVCPDAPECYPVISAGRHRFTVRFMRQQQMEQPTQVEDTVNFQLGCCTL